MSNVLDVIMPSYNTPEEFMIRALNSINKQKNISFKEIGVIIVDDCSTKIKYKKSWFKQRFPKLQITYLVNEINVGPGISRQKAIDTSSAKYITFLDSDDVFYGDNSFAKIISILKQYDLNKINTEIIEEIMDDNGSIYEVKHNYNTLNSIHGLFLNREYLVLNNIRFDDKLRIHEDYYFTRIVAAFCKNSRAYLEEVSYVWKWNDNSLMRTVTEKFNHLEDMLYATVKSNEVIEKSNFPCDSFNNYLSGLLSLYVLLSSNVFDYDEYKHLKPKYELDFLKCYNRNIDKIRSFNNDEIDKIIDKRYNSILRASPWLKIKESFEDFINRLKKTYGDN